MPNGLLGVGSGAAVIFFAYIGFDAVSTVAEEAKRPQRDLPIGIIASLIICTILYIVVAGVFTGIVPYPDLVAKLSTEQAEPLTLALDYTNVKGLIIFIVALGSVIAHLAVLFVFQLGQPRILFSMARDGLLPRFFSKVHPNFRTPWGSTIVTGIAVGGAAMFTSLNEMVDLTNIGTLFGFILVCIGIIVMRVKDPFRKRIFRVPGGIAIPVLGILGCIGLIFYLPPPSWLRFASWLNFGFVIYICYGSLRSKLTAKSSKTDHSALMIKTAYNGAWLGIFGTVLVLIARLGDIKHVGSNYAATLLINSWWLTIPILINVVILCPTIISRALRAKTSPLAEKQIRYANLAIVASSVLLVSSIFYLLLVWIF